MKITITKTTTKTTNKLTALQTYVRLFKADSVISKVAKISEVTQIGRGEKRTRSFMLKAWQKRANEATKKAVALAKKRKKPEEIAAAINAIMEKWRTDVLSVFISEFSLAYRLGREVGYKKATRQIKTSLRYGLPKQTTVTKADNIGAELLPSFDLVDRQNLKALTKHQTFWIGDFYKGGVSQQIAATTKNVMARLGEGSTIVGREMGKQIRDNFKNVRIPSGFVGTPKSYFSGLTANAFTVGRVHGQMRSFAEIGIKSYTISNPVDKRTCKRCAHLDGKRFTTKQGVDAMHNELSAKSKAGVKAAHPWLSLGEIQKLSPKPGYVGGKAGAKDAKALSEAGQALPPFHFKCRCTVDIGVDSMTYSNLIPLTPPTARRPSRPLEMKPPGAKLATLADRLAGMLRTSVIRKTAFHHVEGEKFSFLEMQAPNKKTIKALWKTEGTEKAEASFYRLDRELGGKTIVTPTVARDPGLGSGVGTLQYFEKHWAVTDKITKAQKRRIRLLDFVSGNGQRRKATILKTGAGIALINNDGGFKKTIPKKYYYPTTDKISDLSKTDVKKLKKVGLQRFAEILEQEDISKKAARLALLRAQLVIDKPELLTKSKTKTLWNDLEKDPKKHLKAKDVKKIDKILSSVYK